jgi:hypothetical protein
MNSSDHLYYENSKIIFIKFTEKKSGLCQACKIAMLNSLYYGLHKNDKIWFFLDIWKCDTQIHTFFFIFVYLKIHIIPIDSLHVCCGILPLDVINWRTDLLMICMRMPPSASIKSGRREYITGYILFIFQFFSKGRNTIFSFKKKGDTAAHVHQISTPVPVDVMFSFLL